MTVSPASASAAAALSPEALEDFFENGAVGLHLVDGEGRIVWANRAEMAMLGYEAKDYIGRPIADFHADADTIQDILKRLSAGETLDKYRARLKTRDGSIRHVLISSSVCFDETGKFKNTRCFTVDVTEHVHTDDALREAQQRLSATYENALAGIAELDAEGRFIRVNAPFHEITGYPIEDLTGRSMFDITHPDDAAWEQPQYLRQVAGELERYTVEKRYIHADGRPIWVQVLSSSVRGPAGEFLYGVRVVHDITERKLAEQRRRLLIDELNHRVKNTLATVQSLASHTARGAADLEDFQRRFEGRLAALSKAHDRLTRRNWEGAGLAEIVREELELHGGAARGLQWSGPDVALPPRVALSLSMALYELGTNAVKYGALRSPDGLVSVEWSVSRDAHSRPSGVRLQWRERGGPAVTTPARRGFGFRLLQTMATDMQGKAEPDFDPHGVTWTITFALPDAS